ncbi:hypothetical protein RF11_15108 [Thelohanellus kitauei]|uniref:Integrase zinc-binding domain-containing protein n=1 Tax=Thelohanellus kitauei TaxID=669202 RepID=A0A0C2NL28_THEKT|nr:hypothetical protein RF11_15108 [Thelohanellus kitauei]
MHRNNISCEDDVLVMNLGFPRVLIPKSLQKETLKQIHKGHWGIVRVKQFAKRYCILPGIDRDLEKYAQDYQIGISLLSPRFHTYFNRVHIDFLVPFKGFMWLIAVDANSYFPFVMKMNGFSTSNMVNALKSIFALEGIPKTLVSDNGPSPPYHTESNGQAKRFFQTFKNSISISMDAGRSLDDALFDFFISHRSTPIDGGATPELMHGRQMRCKLEACLSKPSTFEHQTSKFKKGQRLWVSMYDNPKKWIEGEIISDRQKTIAYKDGKRRIDQASKPSGIYQRSNKDLQELEKKLVQEPLRRSARLREESLKFHRGM